MCERTKGRKGGERRGSLQCHTDAGVFKADGQDALVDLVELNQLQQVYEERQTVVHGKVLPACVFTLDRGGQSQLSEWFYPRGVRVSETVEGTHRDHQVVLGLQPVTQ